MPADRVGERDMEIEIPQSDVRTVSCGNLDGVPGSILITGTVKPFCEIVLRAVYNVTDGVPCYGVVMDVNGHRIPGFGVYCETVAELRQELAGALACWLAAFYADGADAFPGAGWSAVEAFDPATLTIHDQEEGGVRVSDIRDQLTGLLPLVEAHGVIRPEIGLRLDDWTATDDEVSMSVVPCRLFYDVDGRRVYADFWLTLDVLADPNAAAILVAESAERPADPRPAPHPRDEG